MSQAGLFADVSKKRLDLERRELSEVESGTCVTIEDVDRGSLDGEPRRHCKILWGDSIPTACLPPPRGISPRRDSWRSAGCSAHRGATDLNVIALGDMNKLGVDLKPMLDVLEMDASLKVAPEDQVTPALLHDAGYKGDH